MNSCSATPSSPSIESPPDDAHAPTVWVMGPMPPPVTGMTLLTSTVVNALRSICRVRLFNWSPGTQRRSIWSRVRRNFRICSSVVQLAAHGRSRNAPIYVVSNAKSGLYATALVVAVARQLGYWVYLHHHVYSYIDVYDWRMAWIDRRLAGRGTHVVHSQKMVDDFRHFYSATNNFETLFPSAVPVATSTPRLEPRTPFRLGMISNLVYEKGVDLVCETFCQLRNRNCDVELLLAGPMGAASIRRLVDDLIREHPDRVQYRGAVYGDEKKRFLSDIDALVFPTRSESWGIVVHEALAAGVPVITFDRGCTGVVMGERTGLLVPPGGDFVAAATQQIQTWISDRSQYIAASSAAIEHARLLDVEGQRQLKQFARRLCCGATNH